MNISWFGLSCFKIQTKDAVVLIDPFGPKTGLKPPHLKADLLLMSCPHEDHSYDKAAFGDPFIIATPGEYELKEVFVYGLKDGFSKKEPGDKLEITVFLMEIEGMTLAHLSCLAGMPDEALMNRLDGVDVLFIPVGGKNTLDADKASEIVSEIEPRIVIPMHYKIPGLKMNIDVLDKFSKSMGVKNIAPEEKLKIIKKDLPQEETKVLILKP